MPIPGSQEFDAIVSAVRLSSSETQTPDTASTRLPALPARDEEGDMSRDLPLWLHYPTNTTISFERLLERISKELAAAQHPKEKEFGLFALAMSTLITGQSGGTVGRLNAVLGSVFNADVNLYFILWAELPQFHQYDIPPFRLGRLRTDRLLQQCTKAQSDFYERYRSLLPRAWSVERQHKPVRILDIEGIRSLAFGDQVVLQTQDRWQHKAWETLVINYFSQLCRFHFEQFWAELVAVQDPLLALGAPFFDPKPVTSFLQSLQVAVFLNMGERRGGFVAPTGQGPISIDLANAHERVPRAFRELKELYGFEAFDGSPLHASIRLFASFVARARRHRITGNANEALLHYVIALELIFGERQAIQRSVSERVGLATHVAAGRSFEEQRRWIDAIYDIRSRYVHAGTAISGDAVLDELHGTCECCFRCLLRLQAAHPTIAERSEAALTQWLATLDYLAKAMIAGRSLDAGQFKEAHLVQDASHASRSQSNQ